MKHESNKSLLEDQLRFCRQKLKLCTMKGNEVDHGPEAVDASMRFLNSSTEHGFDDALISSLDMDSSMYLVPADLTADQFVYVVRKRIKLSPEKSIFIFVKNILPPTAAVMSAIYEENKEEDGFLYMTYSGENTIGIC
ncbi:hypothetical protein SO802_029137 [Lithocarpus litseifolius]|uniref:Autophagy-related protein n=1 Tax=Lithocarpus litseifolius TaxID=425828 RepID=A0AAW2BT90_9ROSI